MLIRKNLPFWIKAISVVYYVGAALSVIIAVLAFSKSGIITKVPGYAQNIASHSQAFSYLGALFVFLSIFFFLVALGLQNRNNVARIALLAFCGINLIGGIMSVIEKSYLSFVSIAFNAAVFSYLLFSKKIRKEFGGKEAAY